MIYTKENLIEELTKLKFKRDEDHLNPSFQKILNSNKELQLFLNTLLGDSFPEKMYLFEHNLTEKPICETCRNPTVFQPGGYKLGYKKYCSEECRRFLKTSKYIIPSLIDANNFKDVITNLNYLRENRTFNSSFPKLCKNIPQLIYYMNTLIGNTISEKIYLWSHNLEKIPRCKECEGDVEFVSYSEGYRDFCSISCKAKSKDILEKQKSTVLEKYGVEHPMHSQVVKNKLKATCTGKYGVDNYFKTEHIKTIKENRSEDEVTAAIKKTQDTTEDRYGVRHPLQSAKLLKNLQDTNLERYGNVCSAQGIEQQKAIADKKKNAFWSRLSSSDRLRSKVYPNFNIEEYRGTIEDVNFKLIPNLYSWICSTCNTKFEDHLANGNIPRCPHCYPPQTQGIFERELLDWIKLIAPNLEIIENSRRIIPPLEIDIYIPSLKIGIEFNEILWHSQVFSGRGEKYHINKTEKCEELGIKLIHIFDSEWFKKPEIIKSMLKNQLGIVDEKIFARKCKIRELSSKESFDFLEDNHLQGYAASSIRFGLYYNNELVSHLALSKNRFRGNTYEVVRFASKKNCVVIGGLSKLWKRSKLLIPNQSLLVSYVDRRFFSGKSNEELGLQFEKKNPPGFYYTKDYKNLENRLKYQKHKLPSTLTEFDANLTEWENMQLNKYDRIWDCGTIVYSGTVIH